MTEIPFSINYRKLLTCLIFLDAKDSPFFKMQNSIHLQFLYYTFSVFGVYILMTQFFLYV